MKPPAVDYVRAEDVRNAVEMLAEYGDESKVLAGGQSLIPLMSFRLATPTVLVDINHATGLDFIHQENGHLRIGAMTRQRDVERDPVVRAANPLLPAALRHVGHPTNRNRGTIGGSVAHADPAAELPALLVGLDADLVVEGPSGGRTIPAAEFFLGVFTTALAFDEILTAVHVPCLPPGTGTAVEELVRRHGDFALVGAFAAIHLDDDGKIDFARLSVSGVDSVPVRLHEVEAALAGRAPDVDAIAEAVAHAAAAVNPTDDVHAPASYRREMTTVMVRRAIELAIASTAGDNR